MNAINPTQPLTFADACRIAAQRDYGRCRPSFRWHNQTYFLCRRCGDWLAAVRFGAIRSERSKCGRNSFCRACASRAVQACKARAKERARECLYTLPTPEPSRFRNSTLAEAWGETSAVLDSVGSIEPDAPPVAEALNPGRLGADAGAFRDAYERGRFLHALRLNPALDVADWQRLQVRQPRGRKPGRAVRKAVG